MAEIRIKAIPVGENMGLFSGTVDGVTDSVTINSFQLPPVVTGLPRINSGQFVSDTLTLDTTGLTGITAYDWREVGGATIGTSATQMGMGHAGKQIECAVACDQGVLVSPPVFIYMSMGMASHDADDVALLALAPHHEATHIAVASGNFEDSATWINGKVPRNGARALIPHGIDVLYDRHRSYRLDWIRIDGTLETSRLKSTYGLLEHLIITRSGTFECGDGAERLPSAYTSEWVISNRTCRTENRFPSNIDLGKDPKLMGRGIINQGARIMWGAFKTPWIRTAVGSAPMTGDTSLTLESTPSGWAVDDVIMIGETGSQFSSPAVVDADYQTEYRTITAIDLGTNTVSWTDALLYDHDHHNASVTRTDLQPGIGNLTRNIVIRSEDGSVPVHQRGHTMDMHMYARQDLWDVEHRDLGRTQKGTNTPVGEFQNNDTEFKYWTQASDTSDAGGEFIIETPSATSNIKSRYPVHGHKLGFRKAIKDIVNGCTVRNTPGWAMTHHDCEMFLNGNVMTDFAGAGMVSETGNETGEWLNNLSSGSKVRSSNTPKNLEFRKGLRGDFARYGVGFFMRSRAIRCNGNFAMGSSWGFTFYHRSQPNDSLNLTPTIPLLSANLDIKDLQGFYNDGTMRPSDYPIIHANDNESAGMSGGGFFVTKPSGQQNHGLNINIQRFKTWAFRQDGILVEYINQYALTDIDAIGSDGAGQGRGINVSANNAQVAVVRPVTEDCVVGVNFDGTDDVVSNALFDDTDNPKFMLVAHTSTGDATSVTYSPAAGQVEADVIAVTRIFAVEPTYIEPSTNVAFKLADYNVQSQTFSNSQRTFLLTDSVSSAGVIPKPGDNMAFPIDGNTVGQGFAMLQHLGEYGYSTISSVPYAIFSMYFSDRLTGITVKTYHGIELTGTVTAYTNNGEFVNSANAPTVSAASISTTEGTEATLDILALASDVDAGTTLILSDSYFAPDHGRVDLAAGVLTFTPDPNYTGTDKGYFWVEDQEGNATRVDVPITVT